MCEYKESDNSKNIMSTKEKEQQERYDSLKQQLYGAISNSSSIIEKCILFHGTENLEDALIFLTKVTEIKVGQKIISEYQPIDMIMNLFSLFKTRQIDCIQYNICTLFVNLSYFMDDFIDYFKENGGIEILQSLTNHNEFRGLLKTPKFFRIYMRLITNIASKYATDFDEDYVIELMKDFTRKYKKGCDCLLDEEEIKLIGSRTMINFFKASEFSTREKRLTGYDCLSRMFHCINGETRENVLWCDFYNMKMLGKFFFPDFVKSRHINDLVDALSSFDNSKTVYMSIYILNQILLGQVESNLECLENSGVYDIILDHIGDDKIGSICLLFINNLMTIENRFIEHVLEMSTHSKTLELFESGSIGIKKECVFFWAIVENYGNAHQRLAIEQDFFVKSSCEALEIEDAEIVTTALFVLVNILTNHPELKEFLDTDAVDEIDIESEEAQSYISSLHEMFDETDDDDDDDDGD